MFSNTRAKGLAYRPDIDGLRAIAVLLVVFFHGGFGEVSGGFIGVDIFFVISGFLITGLISAQIKDGHFSLSDFYARRIKRICPALFLVLALSAIAAFFLLVPSELKTFGRSMIASVFSYVNWHFYTRVGYFDGPAIEKPLLHVWSLAVEEQFYLIWPVLFIVLYRSFSRRTLSHIILACLASSLLASQMALVRDSALAFYLLPFRAWELLLGAWLAIVEMPKLSPRAASLLGVAGFAAIAYAAIAFDTSTPFPGLNALFPCLGAALLIFAGTQSAGLSHKALSTAPARFTGKISYSLYLIHWPLFSFAHLTLDHALFARERVAIIAVSLILAWLSWRFVEMPVRSAKFRLPVLAPATAIVAVILCACGILYNVAHGFPYRVARSGLAADAAKQLGGTTRKESDCLGDTTPKLLGTICPIGTQAQDLQYDFVIWGDSHARHFAAAFSGHARERGLSGLIISVGDCPPFIHESRVSPACVQANAATEIWIKTQRKLKTVFLAGYWANYANNGKLGGPQSDQANFTDTILLLRSLDVQPVIVEDVPTFHFGVLICAERARLLGRSDEHCLVLSRPDFENNTRITSAVLNETASRFDVRLLPTAQAFCEGETCRAERDGVIFYRDTNHLNIAGSLYLGARLNIPWPNADYKSSETATLVKPALN